MVITPLLAKTLAVSLSMPSILSRLSAGTSLVDTYFCIPDNSSKNILELYGSGGSIIARGTIGQGPSGEMTAFLEGENAGYDAKQERNTGEGMIIDPPPVNTYLAETEEFGCAILENRMPSNNFDLGLRNQKVLEACYMSAKLNKSINVSK